MVKCLWKQLSLSYLVAHKSVNLLKLFKGRSKISLRVYPSLKEHCMRLSRSFIIQIDKKNKCSLRSTRAFEHFIRNLKKTYYSVNYIVVTQNLKLFIPNPKAKNNTKLEIFYTKHKKLYNKRLGFYTKL